MIEIGGQRVGAMYIGTAPDSVREVSALLIGRAADSAATLLEAASACFGRAWIEDAPWSDDAPWIE